MTCHSLSLPPAFALTVCDEEVVPGHFLQLIALDDEATLRVLRRQALLRLATLLEYLEELRITVLATASTSTYYKTVSVVIILLSKRYTAKERCYSTDIFSIRGF